MRADRLLSILLLLQAEGKKTARSLAETLEVSERTIYRDMEALSLAGIPVYGEPGPEGGYALLEPYRTDLTGLSEGEARALFVLATQAPLDALEMGVPLRGALVKLSAAVSGQRRVDEKRVRQRFYLDAAGWDHCGEGSPLLRLLERAVWEDRRVVLLFRFGPLAAGVEVEAAPFALVLKGGVWYIVYSVMHASSGADAAAPRVMRVSDLTGVRVLGTGYTRPGDFDLPTFWRGWCAAHEAAHSLYRVQVRVAPALQRALGATAAEVAPEPDSEGWRVMTLAFESLDAARRRLLAYGGAVEVLAPRALRLSMEDYVAQRARVYGG
jgi:predicted DNA-binding transcriptional regulator YafY